MITDDIDRRSRGSTATAIDPYHKVMPRVIPLLMLCYVAAFLDRVNIGFAKLTMLGDLRFSEAAYGFGAGLFFVGYVIFETPSNLLMHRIGARLTLSRIMILWGLISGASAFVHIQWQFYLLRFLLGAAEAGFYPGVILYLTYWFPAARRARVIALFICAIPLSGLIGGPASGSILATFHDVAGLRSWQWLFLIEALPSLVLGVIILACLDDNPGRNAVALRGGKGRDQARSAVGRRPVARSHQPVRRSVGHRRATLAHRFLPGHWAVWSVVLAADADRSGGGAGSARHRLVQRHPVWSCDRVHAPDRQEFGPPRRTPLALGHTVPSLGRSASRRAPCLPATSRLRSSRSASRRPAATR